ncbi:MAG: transposase, partial [Pirellulales bacterium]|nr:transposase [Pirellulales bacterium]
MAAASLLHHTEPAACAPNRLPAVRGTDTIIRDRDTKFTAQFCSILQTDGIEFRPISPRSPNLNPFAEAWVQRTKHEVLNRFIVFGEKHLRYILNQWVSYYHQVRPHQGLGNVP